MINLQGVMFGSFIIGLAFWPFSGKLELARNGRTDYVVVQGEKATGPEKIAVQELTNFLGWVTGASFPVVSESALPRRARGIYVGWTQYASRNGIEAAKLGEEEWIIRRVGKNLVLAGGRPRGTLYAVYEFLERQVGCHWLARDTEIIPSKPTLALDKLDIRGKPWFWKREVFAHAGIPGIQSMQDDDKWKFMVRNKNYPTDYYASMLPDCFPQGAFYKLQGTPGYPHTFSFYVNASKWFESHPEYFSLDASGKRLPAKDGGGPGQLCLTHPDVRRLTAESLRKFIAKDRAEASKKGCPPPRIYDISQNDVYNAHCQCTNCQAIARREGSESGPLIDFINAVAAEIEKDYPDILVQTIAYNLTTPPPKTIKPRPNVIIAWCDSYGHADLTRPLNHPYNARNYKEITSWVAVAPRMAIGDDYWVNQHGDAAISPYCMIQSLGPDLKLFADCHVETFFAESQDYIEDGENFTALKFWLAYQLLVNPYQPVEPLIEIFMDGYYGAASSKMNGYLKYLQERIDKDSDLAIGDFRGSARNAPHSFKYLDVSFFVTAEKLLDEAEALVKPGSLAAQHVQRERFVVDAALLRTWPWLDRKLAANEKMPFDHEAVIRRYEANGRVYIKLQYSRFYSKAGMLEKTAALFRDPKLPGQFRNLPPRDVADFNWLTFSLYHPSYRSFVEDQEAAGETALAFVGGKDEDYNKPLTYGVRDGATVTLKPEEIPQDGKYHLFKIGLVNVKAMCVVWALEGKQLPGQKVGVGVNVRRLFVPNAPDRAVNDWIAYISLKLKGPAYVKGSTDTNGVWMDRVLLVKPQPEKQADAAELRR